MSNTRSGFGLPDFSSLHAPDLGGKENTNIGEESFDNVCGNGIICSTGGNNDATNNKRNTPDQEALIDLAQKAKNTGISEEDAQTLMEWADEYEVEPSSDEIESHPNRNFDKPHIRIGPVNHIEVTE